MTDTKKPKRKRSIHLSSRELERYKKREEMWIRRKSRNDK